MDKVRFERTKSPMVIKVLRKESIRALSQTHPKENIEEIID
jgi:hypothetical protein